MRTAHCLSGEVSIALVLVLCGLLLLVSAAWGPPQQKGDVRLDHGSIGPYAWALGVHRGAGADGGHRPCLVATSGGTRL
jgi:hypothetical protein